MIKISLITDEISADPETAIELGTQWGVRDFELRGYYTDRVPNFSAFQKAHLREVLERYQAQIIAIGPGLFKIPYPGVKPTTTSLAWMDQAGYQRWETAQQNLTYHLNELLPKSLDYANEFGARKVLIFGFDRAGAAAGKPPDEILNVLRLAAERAGETGLELVLENEAGFWADTGGRTAEIIRLVNHRALRINWDPGNAFFTGESPYPDGYTAVRGLIGHVHFKDARANPDGQPVYTMDGQIDWKGQIGALVTDGYDGFISVETHTQPKIASSKILFDRFQSLLLGLPRTQGN